MPEQVVVPKPNSSPKRRSVVIWVALGLALALFLAGLVRHLLVPSDTERIYEIGTAAMASDDLATVQVAAEALTGLEGAEPYAHVLEGFVHLRSGRLPEAAAEFLLAHEHPQTAARANALAGEALYRNRQLADAIRALRTATSLDESMTDAHRRLAAVFYDIGATGPAVEALRTVSEQAPDDPRPHRLLGLIFKDMEAYDKAIPEYREALRRDADMPERDEVLLELAECLRGAWRHEELAETIRQCPRSARTLTMLAESRFRQDDSDHAKKLVEQALSLAPDDLDALLLKGTMELASGSVADAAETLQRAVEKHPYDFRARNKLAQAYARLDQTDLANEQAEESLRLRELRVRFTDLHMKASADVGDADLRYQLGETAMQLGRPDLAMSWFAAALGMDPNHVRARKALQLAAAPQANIHESDAQPAEE